MSPDHVRIWTDPSCPWAWQTAKWLADLEARDLVELEWRVFSLEINASDPDTPYWQACAQQGEALVTLLLARDEGGERAFHSLYAALAERLHKRKERMSPETLRAAATDVGLGELPDRAAATSALVDAVLAEHADARARDVFGVPTLQIGGSKVVYGPIQSVPPTAEEALAMWEHVRWLVERPELLELKRWPRDLRPGQAPT